MKCQNCGSTSFKKGEDGYYCNYCGTFYPESTKKVDWDRYKYEKELNAYYIKTHTTPMTTRERIVDIIFFIIILVILFLGFAARFV